MKKIFVITLISGIISTACSQTKKTDRSHTSVVRTEITYMDITASTFASISPSIFYDADNLFKKVFVSKNICDSMEYYVTKLNPNNKATYQLELDTRVAMKLIYSDSSKKSIFIDYMKQYTIDTSNIVYKMDDRFINYIQKTINDPIVIW